MPPIINPNMEHNFFYPISHGSIDLIAPFKQMKPQPFLKSLSSYCLLFHTVPCNNKYLHKLLIYIKVNYY